MRRHLSVSIVALLCAMPCAAQQAAQNSAGPKALVLAGPQEVPDPAAWGVVSPTAATYSAAAFTPVDSTVIFADSVSANNVCRYRANATGSPFLEATINLPNGSLVQAVEIRFCDTSATKEFSSFLTINDKAGSVSQVALVSSTSGEAPGCINRTFTLAAPVQVDNTNKAYSLEANLGGAVPGDSTIAVCQAHVYYKLQVSPAPATSTFGDVPVSHPFHRFIEALVRSGITAGCGAGNYCPDSGVTRGQMAVFLSVALGLHFPN